MKLLKSKFAVAILVLIALGVVFERAILPIYNSMEKTTAALEVLRNPTAVIVESKAETDKSYFKNLAWVLDLKKDPFITIQDLPEKFIESVLGRERHTPPPDKEKLKKTKRKKKQRYRLVGIVVEPDIRFAVINDTVVAEGDRYKGYKVVKIDKDSVLLKGSEGTKLLRF